MDLDAVPGPQSEKPAVYVVGSDGTNTSRGSTPPAILSWSRRSRRTSGCGSAPNLLNILNTAYDPAGKPTGTGTTAPTVERDILQAKTR